MDDRIQFVAVIAAGAVAPRRARAGPPQTVDGALRTAVAAVRSGAAGLAAWRGGLEVISKALGIAYPPNALFVVAFAFILLLLLHFSQAVSR